MAKIIVSDINRNSATPATVPTASVQATPEVPSAPAVDLETLATLILAKMQAQPAPQASAAPVAPPPAPVKVERAPSLPGGMNVGANGYLSLADWKKGFHPLKVAAMFRAFQGLSVDQQNNLVALCETTFAKMTEKYYDKK